MFFPNWQGILTYLKELSVPLFNKKNTGYIDHITNFLFSSSVCIFTLYTFLLKLAKSMGIFYKMRYILKREMMKLLYSAIVTPHITNCNIIKQVNLTYPTNHGYEYCSFVYSLWCDLLMLY